MNVVLLLFENFEEICIAFQVQEQMESGQNFERLPELHALACGLKVPFLR